MWDGYLRRSTSIHRGYEYHLSASRYPSDVDFVERRKLQLSARFCLPLQNPLRTLGDGSGVEREQLLILLPPLPVLMESQKLTLVSFKAALLHAAQCSYPEEKAFVVCNRDRVNMNTDTNLLLSNEVMKYSYPTSNLSWIMIPYEAVAIICLEECDTDVSVSATIIVFVLPLFSSNRIFSDGVRPCACNYSNDCSSAQKRPLSRKSSHHHWGFRIRNRKGTLILNRKCRYTWTFGIYLILIFVGAFNRALSSIFCIYKFDNHICLFLSGRVPDLQLK